MFILDWYREFLRIRDERRCQNCEYLKTQLEIEQQFNKILFDKLTNTSEEKILQTNEMTPAKPRFIPWRVRKEMLESEDRRAAQVMRAKQEELRHRPVIGKDSIDGVQIAPPDDPDVVALEKEMGIIERERENASKSN